MPPEHRRSRNVSVRLTQEQHAFAAAVARESGRTVSSLIAVALKHYLNDHLVLASVPDVELASSKR